MIRTIGKLLFISIINTLMWVCGQSQPCTNLGQTPSTAFPVCGTTSFRQTQVPTCSGRSLTVPGCASNVPYSDKNPYWYKFTCFVAGTLGFTITPNNLSDDYDWQLYDITGLNADAVYTNSNIVVTGNWAGNPGPTGASATGSTTIQCASAYNGTEPRFARMPNLVVGHTYLLMVSHYTDDGQSGYALSFAGGTASITDTTPPRMKALQVNCDGKSLYVKLNKKMRCSSVATNGSDFTLSPAVANVTAALPIGCSSSFDIDSIVLTTNNPIPPGVYDLLIKNGTDGNTILDYCDTPIPDTNKLSVIVYPSQPTPMDSIVAVQCKPSMLQLVFRNPMLCSSIEPSGSDFVLTGTSNVSIVGASGTCSNGKSSIINLQLSAPIKVGGLYTVTLKKGSDGNTLVNECSLETPEGATIRVQAYDSVNTSIQYTVGSSCINDTLKLWHNGGNGINSWNWKFNDGAVSSRRDTSRIYNSGTMSVQLTVSNGICRDSSILNLDFNKNRVKAAFAAPNFVCPLDTALFVDNSTGPITSWLWDFGNGITSVQKVPALQVYPPQTILQEVTARLTVSSSNGCSDVAIKTITIPANCYIAVPTAFTPNADGLNDYLYPLNAYKAQDLDFAIFNRYGEMIWHTNDWTSRWDGRINGKPQPSGIYVWHLTYTQSDNGKKVDLKGTTMLIR